MKSLLVRSKPFDVVTAVRRSWSSFLLGSFSFVGFTFIVVVYSSGETRQDYSKPTKDRRFFLGWNRSVIVQDTIDVENLYVQVELQRT